MIFLTVYSNGIRLHSERMTFGFYRDWADYFAEGTEWKLTVAIIIRADNSIFLLR